MSGSVDRSRKAALVTLRVLIVFNFFFFVNQKISNNRMGFLMEAINSVQNKYLEIFTIN